MTLDDIVVAVKALYPSAMRVKDYTVNVDSAGNATLGLWNNAVGPQPTADQLTVALTASSLATSQAAQTVVIQSAFAAATLGTLPYMGTTFYSDQQSQFLLLGAAWGYTQAGAVPAGFAFWDSTGKPIEMTLVQLQGLAQAMLTLYNTNFVKMKTYIASIAAATTVAAVQSIVWA